MQGDKDVFTPIDGPVGRLFAALPHTRPATAFRMLPGDACHAADVCSRAGSPHDQWLTSVLRADATWGSNQSDMYQLNTLTNACRSQGECLQECSGMAEWYVLEKPSYWSHVGVGRTCTNGST